MGISVQIPNESGPMIGRGGAPAPSMGSMPGPPNQTGAAGDKRNEVGQTRNPGGFPPIPNEHAPMPGHGGKM